MSSSHANRESEVSSARVKWISIQNGAADATESDDGITWHLRHLGGVRPRLQ
jgi:hypothetical protein